VDEGHKHVLLEDGERDGALDHGGRSEAQHEQLQRPRIVLAPCAHSTAPHSMHMQTTTEGLVCEGCARVLVCEGRAHMRLCVVRTYVIGWGWCPHQRTCGCSCASAFVHAYLSSLGCTCMHAAWNKQRETEGDHLGSGKRQRVIICGVARDRG